jgi:cytochrome c oxidase cbb3-type subunit 1
MWRAFDDFGNLQYAFIEAVAAAHNLYIMRAVGGLFFLSGMVLMSYNMYKTIKSGTTEQA